MLLNHSQSPFVHTFAYCFLDGVLLRKTKKKASREASIGHQVCVLDDAMVCISYTFPRFSFVSLVSLGISANMAVPLAVS